MEEKAPFICVNVILFCWRQFLIAHKVHKDHMLYLLCRGSSCCAWTKTVSDLHSFSPFSSESWLCHFYVNHIQYLAALSAVSPGAAAGKVLNDCRLYLLSLSRLSTSNRFPYKWCFSLLSFNCCCSLCSGSNTESDNNTLFQLNSLMCDLCLKNCFLLNSEALWTLKHNVFIYANTP